MLEKKPESVPLNQTDFLWMAMNRAFPSFANIVETVRFTTKHSPEEMRQALRRITSLYSRMRLYIRPTIFSYRVCAYDDGDERLEKYFDEAFRVFPDVLYDSPEYREQWNLLLNKPFKLTEGLPFSISYFPDDPEPALIVAVHHIVSDGIGLMHRDGAIVALLNGREPDPVPLENPSQAGAIFERPWYRIPVQMVRSYRRYRQLASARKNDKPFILAGWKPAASFSPVNNYHRYLFDLLPALKAKAREHGCTITVLFSAALATALRKCAGQGNAAHLYQFIDMRPFYQGTSPIFGNYTTTGIIRVEDKIIGDMPAMLDTITKQLEINIDFVRKRDLLYPFMLNKITTFMGIRLYTVFAHMLKRKGTLYPACILSNMGNVDRINAHGDRARLTEALGAVTQMGIFYSIGSINGRTSINVSFPINEIGEQEIIRLVDTFEECIRFIVNQ